MPTYINFTAFGLSLIWDAAGLYLRAGKAERFWSSLPQAKA